MRDGNLNGSEKRLRERLLDRSRLARKQALDLPDGPERERLLNDAQHCERAADIAELLDRAHTGGLLGR